MSICCHRPLRGRRKGGGKWREWREKKERKKDGEEGEKA
jgi:hypothetical protein